MKTSSKKSFIIPMVLMVVYLSVGIVTAQNNTIPLAPGNAPATGSDNNGSDLNPGNKSNTLPKITNPLSGASGKDVSIGSVVNKFVEIFSYLAILVAVLMIVWVGFQFVLARGNPARMNELKNWLLYIVIGVAIILGARIIIEVIINTLSATGAVSPDVIRSADNVINRR